MSMAPGARPDTSKPTRPHCKKIFPGLTPWTCLCVAERLKSLEYFQLWKAIDDYTLLHFDPGHHGPADGDYTLDRTAARCRYAIP